MILIALPLAEFSNLFMNYTVAIRVTTVNFQPPECRLEKDFFK